MLTVFVCEDNDQQRDRIATIIDNYIFAQRLDIEWGLSTANPNEIIEHVRKNPHVGLYFIDIELKNADMNGFKLAQHIRQHDPRGFIIFVTSHAELSFLTFTYKVEALDYVIKDDFSNIQNRLHECLDKVEERVSTKGKAELYFTLKVSDKKIVRERFDDILFFETSTTPHKVILHSKSRQIEFYAKLRNIEKDLNGHFKRCHRSVIVNTKNVVEFDKENGILTMTNGEQCYVSLKRLSVISLK